MKLYCCKQIETINDKAPGGVYISMTSNLISILYEWPFQEFLDHRMYFIARKTCSSLQWNSSMKLSQDTNSSILCPIRVLFVFLHGIKYQILSDVRWLGIDSKRNLWWRFSGANCVTLWKRPTIIIWRDFKKRNNLELIFH